MKLDRDGQHNGYGANEFSKLRPRRWINRRTLGIQRRSSQRMSSVSMTSTLGCSRSACAATRGEGGCGTSLGEAAASRRADGSGSAAPQPTATAPMSPARTNVATREWARVGEMRGPRSCLHQGTTPHDLLSLLKYS